MHEQSPRLPVWKKVIYDTGDWRTASFSTLRQLFYAIFLTDVVGLELRLASFVALVSILRSTVNDPIVGTLTDRTRMRWGRRHPSYRLHIQQPRGFLPVFFKMFDPLRFFIREH